MRLLTPLALFALGIIASGSKGRGLRGEWGGEHVRLSATADGATVEFDCARGSLDTVTMDKEGRFDVAGVFVAEHGGPVRRDESQEGRPVRYKGTVTGDTMKLEVVPEGGETIGSFQLTRGGRAHLVKCR